MKQFRSLIKLGQQELYGSPLQKAGQGIVQKLLIKLKLMFDYFISAISALVVAGFKSGSEMLFGSFPYPCFHLRRWPEYLSGTELLKIDHSQ